MAILSALKIFFLPEKIINYTYFHITIKQESQNAVAGEKKIDCTAVTLGA